MLDFKYRTLPYGTAEQAHIPVLNISRKRYQRGLLVLGSTAYQIVANAEVEAALKHRPYCVCSATLHYYPRSSVAVATLEPIPYYEATNEPLPI